MNLRKLTSLFLILLIIFSSVLAFTSCVDEPEDPPKVEEPEDPEAPEAPESPDDPTGGTPSTSITVPPYKDYGRGTKDFGVLALDYKRPDTDKLVEKFNTVSTLIRENALSFEEQVAKIEALDPLYDEFKTMYSVADIFASKDTTDGFWTVEYDKISVSAPSLSQAIEDMYVAAARSPHAERFESEYFGFDIDEYKDGGKYTDAAVAYMKEETGLENEYKSLSPATVEISYDYLGFSVSGTYEKVLEALAKKYAASSTTYSVAAQKAESLYNTAYNLAQAEIYVELIKLRALLATELGYSSYLELAYDDRDYDYTPSDMEAFIDAIAEHAVPTLQRLYPSSDIKIENYKLYRLINAGYEVAGKLNSELGEIYAYMLQHGLYDASTTTSTRLNGSFTTYLETNNSPFMFITGRGTASDFSTIMHEFGHFADAYVNNGLPNQLETAELCSQGLEYLAMIEFGKTVSASLYDALTYSSVIDALDTLCYQAMLADFEHSAYSLAPHDVTVKRLEELAAEISVDMLGATGAFFGLSDLLVLHSFIAPLYVQSYCTSIVPALELYLLAMDGKDGIGAYMKLLHRESDEFTAALSAAGLSSPFADGTLPAIMDGLSGVVSAIIYRNEAAA